MVVGHDERLPAGGAPFFEPVFEEWGVYRRLAAEAAAVDDDDDERSDDGATFRALYDDSAALDGLRREREALARKVADVLGSRGLGGSLKDLKRRGVDAKALLADLRARRLLVSRSIDERAARIVDVQTAAAPRAAPPPPPRRGSLPPVKRRRRRQTSAAAARGPRRRASSASEGSTSR